MDVIIVKNDKTPNQKTNPTELSINQNASNFDISYSCTNNMAQTSMSSMFSYDGELFYGLLITNIQGLADIRAMHIHRMEKQGKFLEMGYIVYHPWTTSRNITDHQEAWSRY